MNLSNLPQKLTLATVDLVSIVGVTMELAGLNMDNQLIDGLDEANRDYWIGYRDAIVRLIAEGTGMDVVVVRHDLYLKLQDYLLEDTIEELFGE